MTPTPHKPKSKPLIILSLILFGLILFVISTGFTPILREEPFPVEIYFADHATLEQASALIATTDAQIAGQWRYQIDYNAQDGLWSGGVSYALGTDIQAARNEIWQHYNGTIQWLTQDAEQRIITEGKDKGRQAPENFFKQLNTHQAELTYLTQNIGHCWDTNTCPPLPVKSVNVMATNATMAQIRTSILIKSATPIYPPPAFFLMRALGLLNPT